MLYGGEVTVPKSTTEDSPVETTFKLSHGVITKVLFYPRPGHASLCHAKVYHWTHQLIPMDPEQDLHGDNHPIIWEEWYEMFYAPFELKVKAWNDDDTYPHTFDIWFDMLPKWVSLPYAFAKAIADFFGLSFGRQVFGGSE